MADVSPITQYRITDHARFEMARRGITESELVHVLSAPEQAEMVRPDRKVLESMTFGQFLLAPRGCATIDM